MERYGGEFGSEVFHSKFVEARGLGAGGVELDGEGG